MTTLDQLTMTTRKQKEDINSLINLSFVNVSSITVTMPRLAPSPSLDGFALYSRTPLSVYDRGIESYRSVYNASGDFLDTLVYNAVAK